MGYIVGSVVLLMLLGLLLILSGNETKKFFGKILIGIALTPIVLVLLFFLTCLVILAIGSISS